MGVKISLSDPDNYIIIINHPTALRSSRPCLLTNLCGLQNNWNVWKNEIPLLLRPPISFGDWIWRIPSSDRDPRVASYKCNHCTLSLATLGSLHCTATLDWTLDIRGRLYGGKGSIWTWWDHRPSRRRTGVEGCGVRHEYHVGHRPVKTAPVFRSYSTTLDSMPWQLT